MEKLYFIDTSNPGFVAKKPFIDANGFLRCAATVTASKVLQYSNGKETFNVLRHPDQVFDKASLSTLAGVPLTLSHPIVDGKPVLVTPENWKKYAVGFVGDSIETHNPYVLINGLSIQDAIALETINDSRCNKQLSPGYQAVIQEEDGIFDGIPYQFRQMPCVDSGIIQYNHVSMMDIGENGRNGEDVKLLLDSLSVFVDTGEIKEIKKPVIVDLKPKKIMPNFILVDAKDHKTGKSIVKGVFQIDGDNNITIPASQFQYIVDLNSEQFAALMDASANSEAVEASEDMANIKTLLAALQMDSVQTLVDSYQEKSKELETLQKTPIVDSGEEFGKKVQERCVLIDSAQNHVEGDLHSLSNREIKEKVLSVFDSEEDYTKYSDPEINGAFKAALKILDSRSEGVKKQARTVQSVKESSNTVVADMDTVRANLRNARQRKA